ncbi:MAG TPA: ribosome small subunit-dependent GTPase A [Tepidisphaeraceae bacterium]|jgi:ribosome biogenesis GTPase|nr:ribosome small subunit-dependent GTPase A [Tepidisphaeraceae bacterium]
MPGHPKKSSREKDLTSRYLRGDLDQDRVNAHQRHTTRSRRDQTAKTLRTAIMRAEEPAQLQDIDSLPLGEVVQVFSLFSEVEHDSKTYLCVARRTLQRISDTQLVVGDRVRFRPVEARDESGREEAVIEQVLPRTTILTRADSFKQRESHPIVANAQQMLIVASLLEPDVKWGLVDRMILVARSGNLDPIICLNKVDLASEKKGAPLYAQSQQALAYYRQLSVRTLETSVEKNLGLDQLREILHNQTTVLAGHSGVGKSSLIRSIQPSLDLRVAPISGYTGKGRHTTTSARRYPLTQGGFVIDTPGVKLFGLWAVTPDNVGEYFHDVLNHTAPDWRQESYNRIIESFNE